MKKGLNKTKCLTGLLSFLGAVSIFLILIFIGNEPVESQGFYEEKPAPSKKLFKRGEVLYQKQCAVCHGIKGAGDGKAAYLLYPKPRDFVSDKFRLISTTNQEASNDDIFKAIKRGMAGSSMPPWKHLSEEDRWALVYYVRYLSEIESFKKSGEMQGEIAGDNIPWESIHKILSKHVPSEKVITIPEEPKVTQEGLARGRELFKASCAGCHGMQGRGDGQQNMVDSKGLPTKPRDLTAGVFKGDSSSEELYFRMIAGMPGSPMPSYNEVFTQEQIWDLIHFVQSLVPEGKEEKTQLKQVQITAQRISDEIDMNPFAQHWSKANSVYVSLTPLWWRDDRIEGVDIRAIYNEDKIAFKLTWSDPKEDDNLVEVQSFSDGAALQFSMDNDPPFFGMGAAGQPVYIWHWKAGWEEKESERQDIETQYPHTATDFYESQKNYEHGTAFETAHSKTKFHDPKYTTGWGAGNPVSDPTKEETAEEGISEGMGSYTAQRPKMEKVDARGIWTNGKWHVVFVRPLKGSDKGSLKFKSGDTSSVAFAIWDGAGGDRNGQKMVSIWNKLILEK
ncbi:MAG: c-type cytochrome [Candidatus Omnitrophica bacterium]|nr:c-type cytochrome [Candidatus Omnitrophota bacterium]MCA9407091.1 c-type cytochrome [Candidatus Omnitrophota bacterium]